MTMVVASAGADAIHVDDADDDSVVVLGVPCSSSVEGDDIISSLLILVEALRTSTGFRCRPEETRSILETTVVVVVPNRAR